MKSKTLEQKGYYVEGSVELLLWGDDKGSISFTPFKILKELDIKDVIMTIDDGGFGCQKLLEAEVDIYELYEGGYKEYVETRAITLEELDKYNYINNGNYIEETYGERFATNLDFITE